MSSAAVLACDGCGATVDQIRYGGNDRAIYPAGWLRLTVTGRQTGEDRMVNLAKLDVCSPECAPAALKESAGRVVAPEPDPPA